MKSNKAAISFLFILCMPFSLLWSQSRNTNFETSGGPQDPLQSIMDIRHYTLALDVDVEQKKISGYTVIDLILSQPTDTLLFNLAHQMVVKKITVANKSAVFLQQSDLIFILNPQGFGAEKQSVKIEYSGTPPQPVRAPWDGGFNWAKDANGNPWMAINCQSEGGDIYFPCKDHPGDEPNEGVDLLITVPKGLSVAGPGLLQSTKNNPGNKVTFHWKTNYTISNYCIVFNIGKYKVVNRTYTTIAGNKVPMQFYVLEEDTAYAQHALEIKERDTKILEKYFGEYPWVNEKIGLAEVPNSGMEHQTMITYGDKFRYHKLGGQDYSDNLFHEYAHEWWANKVTNTDWAHMWIQEGIATYAEALAMLEIGGEKAYDSLVLKFRMRIENKKPVVQAEVLNGTDAYMGDIYHKGAFFMHTLRHVTGDNIFFPTLKELATDQKYTYSNFVNTTDVEQLFSRKSGRDLKPLFDFYLRTTNRLEITVKQVSADEYSVQTTNAPMNFLVDIRTDAGTTQIQSDNKAVKIKSNILPVIDEKGYYFKKVIFL